MLILPTRETRRRRRAVRQYNPAVMFNRGLVAQTGFIPEGTQLLQDTWPLVIQDKKDVLVEAVGGGKRKVSRVTGIFQVAENENANGRVYTRPVLSEAVQAIQEDITSRAVFGEFDHPQDAKIHLDRISHLITKLWMDGNNVYGEAQILEELPFGAQLRVLLENGRVGISSRGIGDMEVRESNGQEVYYVLEGYRFVTMDVVAEPSVKGAVLHLMEGKLVPRKKIIRPAAPTIVFSDKRAREKLMVEELHKILIEQ